MGFIFFILLLVVGFGVAILLSVLGIIRTIFGFGRNRNTFQGEDASKRKTYGNPFKQEEEKPKVFSEKEGEYVDYEEIND